MKFGTLLHCAIEHDRYEAVMILIESGASVELTNSEGLDAYELSNIHATDATKSLLPPRHDSEKMLGAVYDILADEEQDDKDKFDKVCESHGPCYAITVTA